MYVIGEDGILEELNLKGIKYLGGPTDGAKMVKLSPGELMEHDAEVIRIFVIFLCTWCLFHF